MRNVSHSICALLLLLGLAGCRQSSVPAGPPVSLEQFAAEVEQQPGLVVVDFWAPWCPPCRAFKPVFEKVEPAYAGRVKFFKVDVDQGEAVAQKFGIQSIPTLILFQGGKPLAQQVGAFDEAGFRAWLDAALAGKALATP